MSTSTSPSAAGSSTGQRRFVDDPRFKQGLVMMKEKKYEEALQFWEPIMQAM